MNNIVGQYRQQGNIIAGTKEQYCWTKKQKGNIIAGPNEQYYWTKKTTNARCSPAQYWIVGKGNIAGRKEQCCWTKQPTMKYYCCTKRTTLFDQLNNEETKQTRIIIVLDEFNILKILFF